MHISSLYPVCQLNRGISVKKKNNKKDKQFKKFTCKAKDPIVLLAMLGQIILVKKTWTESQEWKYDWFGTDWIEYSSGGAFLLS